MPPVDMEESQNIDPTSYTTPGSSASLAQPSDPISASSSAISQPSSDKSGLPPVPTPSAKPGTITPILPDASGAITTDPLAPTHPVDVISNLPAELQDSSAIILSSQLVNPETPSTCSPPPMIHPQQAIDRGPSASYSIPAVSSNTSIQPQHPLQQQQKSKREDDEGSRVTATLFRRRQAYNSECQRDWGMQIVAHLVRNNTRSASRQVCVEFVQSELENNSEHLPKTYFDVLIDCIELFTNNDIVDLEELAQCLTKLEKAASEIGDFTHQGWEKADKLRRTFGDAQKSKIINLMRETGQTKSIEEPEVRLVPSCICEYVLSCIFLNYAGVRRTAINAFQSDADGYLDYIAVLSAIWEGGRSVQIAKDVYTEIANLCNCPKEKRLSESVWKDRLYYFDRNSTGRVKTGVLLSEILVDSSAAWRPPFNEWPEDKFRVVIQPWVDGDHCEYIPIFEFMVKHGREWRRQFEKQRKEEEQRRAEQARMDRQEHEEKKRKRGEEGEIKAEEDTEEDDHDQKSLRTNEPDRYSSGHL
ncbi:hypothetical protein DFJ77DRAFT_57779 [Powellomyces hirtus]|nr:hypothetical protein DFJ77DRAFT_57779 [Powellomyces hirtus]